jgi:hypothetical protein
MMLFGKRVGCDLRATSTQNLARCLFGGFVRITVLLARAGAEDGERRELHEQDRPALADIDFYNQLAWKFACLSAVRLD